VTLAAGAREGCIEKYPRLLGLKSSRLLTDRRPNHRQHHSGRDWHARRASGGGRIARSAIITAPDAGVVVTLPLHDATARRSQRVKVVMKSFRGKRKKMPLARASYREANGNSSSLTMT